MAPRDFRELALARSDRAEQLAALFPAASSVLDFYARVAEFQAVIWHRTLQFDQLPGLVSDVAEFIDQNGTDVLKDAARKLNEATFQRVIIDYWQRIDTSSINSLFGRIVLQPYACSAEVDPVDVGENVCPRCGHLPQVGVLYPLAHGNELKFVCSLCMTEWIFPRVRCAGCLSTDQKNLEFHSLDDFSYLQSQSCSSCSRYILFVDKGENPQAIPMVDELAALTLDVWNVKQGFEKLQLNMGGI